MSYSTTTDSLNSDFKRGEGYLYFVGCLQIVAGVLTILFSLLAMAQAWYVTSTVLMKPTEIYTSFSGSEGTWFNNLVAGYLSFQVMFGWMIGLLMIFAGRCCLNHRGEGWVRLSGWLSLLVFPHGTTVGLMVIHGLSRPGITAALR